MKTDYKRANKIKEEWPENTPLAPRDKMFIALVVVIVLATACHGLLSYGSLATGDERGDLLWWLFFDVLIAAVVSAQMIFPQPFFLADELIRRSAKSLIDGMRLFCGVCGVTMVLFFAYVLETDLLAVAAFDVRVIFGFCAVLTIELVVYFAWLLRRR